MKVATDPEAQSSTVSIMTKRPASSDETVGDYRRSLVQQLASRMMNERFSEIARRPDAAFLNAVAGVDITLDLTAIRFEDFEQLDPAATPVAAPVRKLLK